MPGGTATFAGGLSAPTVGQNSTVTVSNGGSLTVNSYLLNNTASTTVGNLAMTVTGAGSTFTVSTASGAANSYFTGTDSLTVSSGGSFSFSPVAATNLYFARCDSASVSPLCTLTIGAGSSFTANASTTIYFGTTNSPGVLGGTGVLTMTGGTFTNNGGLGLGNDEISGCAGQLSISGGAFTQVGATTLDPSGTLATTATNSIAFSGNATGAFGGLVNIGSSTAGGDATNVFSVGGAAVVTATAGITMALHNTGTPVDYLQVSGGSLTLPGGSFNMGAGNAAATNYLQVSGSGTASITPQFQMGLGNSGTGYSTNIVQVTGGSLAFSAANGGAVGNGTGASLTTTNSITVSAGAFSSGNLQVGSTSTSCFAVNTLAFTGGTSTFANAGAAALDMERGLLTINGGVVTVDQLTAKTTGTIAFTSGTLNTAQSSVANLLTIGNSVLPATLNLYSESGATGVQTFTGGLTVAANAQLTGTAVLACAITDNGTIKMSGTTQGAVGLGNGTINSGGLTMSGSVPPPGPARWLNHHDQRRHRSSVGRFDRQRHHDRQRHGGQRATLGGGGQVIGAVGVNGGTINGSGLTVTGTTTSTGMSTLAGTTTNGGITVSSGTLTVSGVTSSAGNATVNGGMLAVGAGGSANFGSLLGANGSFITVSGGGSLTDSGTMFLNNGSGGASNNVTMTMTRTAACSA